MTGRPTAEAPNPRPLQLAFSHLNLRRNPFGALDRMTRAELAVVPAIEVGENEVVQFMGQAGRGKTTHLLALHLRWPGSVYEYIPEGSDRYHTRSLPAVGFLLDEAQRLPPRRLRRMFARARRLVLATHEDVSRYSRRPVRTIEIAGLSAAKLNAIAEARIESARRAPGPIPRLSADACERLVQLHGDDLRAIEYHLYGVFQELPEVCDVEEV